MVLPVSSPLSPPVLVELQQADLITSEECKRLPVLSNISGVVDVQKGKSPEMMSVMFSQLQDARLWLCSVQLSGPRVNHSMNSTRLNTCNNTTHAHNSHLSHI